MVCCHMRQKAMLCACEWLQDEAAKGRGNAEGHKPAQGYGPAEARSRLAPASFCGCTRPQPVPSTLIQVWKSCPQAPSVPTGCFLAQQTSTCDPPAHEHV